MKVHFNSPRWNRIKAKPNEANPNEAKPIQWKWMPTIVTVVALLAAGCDASSPASDKPVPDKPVAEKKVVVKPPAEGSLRMNVNTATLTELETIPGVGDALAKLIVAGRPYAAVDELEKVAGIGPKSLKELRPYVKVDGELEKLR